MKLSQFNVVHEHNGSLLIMNARTGGILSLNPEYAQKFKRIGGADKKLDRVRSRLESAWVRKKTRSRSTPGDILTAR